jgi:hypothetical protein
VAVTRDLTLYIASTCGQCMCAYTDFKAFMSGKLVMCAVYGIGISHWISRFVVVCRSEYGGNFVKEQNALMAEAGLP